MFSPLRVSFLMDGSPFCRRSRSFSLSLLSSDRAGGDRPRRSLDRERVRWYLNRSRREREPDRDLRERDDDRLFGDLERHNIWKLNHNLFKRLYVQEHSFKHTLISSVCCVFDLSHHAPSVHSQLKPEMMSQKHNVCILCIACILASLMLAVLRQKVQKDFSI